MTERSRIPLPVAMRVLARAAELDGAQDTWVSMPELESQAAARGISSSAVHRAVAELDSSVVVVTFSEKISSRQLTIAAVILVMCLIAIWMFSPWSPIQW
jgi:hypothetical protein